MKTLTVVLLAVVLCVERVSSLHCYICDNVKSHDECRSVRCSGMEKFCVTQSKEDSAHPREISKWCSDSCPNQSGVNSRAGDIKMKVDCCQEDNCNTGGSMSVKASYTVMGVATLASFFYVLRTGL